MTSSSHRLMIGHPGRKDRYLVERVRLLYGQATVGITGNLICAALVYGALLPEGDGLELLAWGVVMLAVTATRVWLVGRFRRSARQASAVHLWLRYYLAITFCSGLAYGYASLFLLEGQPEPFRLLLYLVVASLGAGAVATYSAVLPVFLAFCLPALLGLSLHFALGGDRLSLIYAAGTLLFLAILTINARKQSRSIDQTLRIKFENLDLIGILAEAKGKAEALNDSLKAEIAERRRVETDLAQSVALYQATMDAVEEGILALDNRQHAVATNQRFRQLWNLTEEDLAVGADARPGMAQAAAQTSGGASHLAEYDAEAGHGLIELTDGRVFEHHSVPYRLHGEVIGKVLTIRDVTARITAERELRRAKETAEAASRAKSDFLAHISHELRTPLNAIIGFSDIFRREMFGDLPNDRYRSYANDIHDSAIMLLSLINDILDLSKIEAGRGKLVEEKISVANLVTSTVRLIRGRAGEAGIKIGESLPPRLPNLRGDERACKQMLANLLTNAVKFTEPGGRVDVTADLTASGELALTVTDTGIGMAAKDIPRALEPFSQIDSPMTRRHQGTGLGLPLVKSLIELHGGRLELDSEPGRGTVARLVFPASRMMPAPLVQVRPAAR
ncbi:MAG TPA: ATP-binding protein [Alphaproteobacteria bacterium]|nr:ATP-binding protein [Alphaproteobacteria bacterium]